MQGFAPHQRGKAMGRAKGFHPKPKTRHPILVKRVKIRKRAKSSSLLEVVRLIFFISTRLSWL
jgi:hypothetical protein